MTAAPSGAYGTDPGFNADGTYTVWITTARCLIRLPSTGRGTPAGGGIAASPSPASWDEVRVPWRGRSETITAWPVGSR